MKDFLEKFFAGTKYDVELRTLPLVEKFFGRDSGVLAAFASRHKTTNIYFGCCTRENKASKVEDCRELVAFWTDIDFKESSEEEARERLRTFELRPSIIIASGGGLHAYWLLKEPMDAQDKRCRPILKGLASAIGGDQGATDIARILRLPGSYNCKPQYKKPILVTVEEAIWTRRYDLDVFLKYEHTVIKKINTNGKITEGGRNNNLSQLAGLLNRQGLGLAAIEKTLLTANSAFDPPLSEREVLDVAKSISRYPSGNGDDAVETSIETILASSVEPEPLFWLWEYRIPLGKLTVFFGMPDVGKSTISIDIAARGTKGLPWPDSPNTHGPFGVLMLISEDDRHDIVVPRLMAAGADLDKIHFAIQTIITSKKTGLTAERQIALDSDLDNVEKLLINHPDIKLVIIDPLGSYLGKMKKNNEEDIRKLLLKMKELAERMKVAIISMDHFNKNIEQAALHRLSGAGALSAIPRAVWAFVKDQDDPDKLNRLMLNAKLNVVSEAKKAGLSYRIGSSNFEIKNVASSQPKIEWQGKNEGDLDEILKRRNDPEKSQLGKCSKWIEERFAGNKRVFTRDILADGENAGFSEMTLRRAMRKLNTKAVKTTGGWQMELPAIKDQLKNEM